MSASIKDVAREANVSVSTVSRALNGYSDVNEDTRKKIENVASKIGYTPNLSARNLSAKVKKNVGLIVSDLLYDRNPDEYTFSLIKGVYSYIAQTDYIISFTVTTTQEQKDKSFDQLCMERSLLGAVFYGLRLSDPYVEKLKSTENPCVTVDLTIEGDHVRSATTDDRKAFEEITDYVISSGYRKLVLAFGRREAVVAQNRYRGFCDALDKNGIDLNQVQIIETDFNQETAYQTTKALLQGNKIEKGSAFVCMSDMTAISVLNAVLECGYRVPQDFAVSGFDGVSARSLVRPQLATIDQNVFEKGYEAAKLLINMLEGRKDTNNVVVPYSLDKGESVTGN